MTDQLAGYCILAVVTDSEKIAFKNRLKQAAQQLIEQRIAAAKTLIDNAREAANSEEKSSVGDKYETARAMGQLETEMHSKQLAQQIRELALLHEVKADVAYATATMGACIKCADLTFFIAAGLGKQTIDGKPIIFLSPQAPLAKLLQNKKAGESFVFNGKETVIERVY
jgi:transcription elongation GreA/GreB family factor